MSQPIVFYDIPGNAPEVKAWSPNTWKTRFSLNIKGIPYRTVWVEYPDIEGVCKKIGAPPTSTKPDGSPHYTLPTIHDPNTGASISESVIIARYLDKTYPSYGPALIPPETDALHEAFLQAFRAALFADVVHIVVAPTAARLRPGSTSYFRITREAMFKTKLEDFPEPGSEKWLGHWSGVERALSTFKRWLCADGQEKPFFMGDRISFADVTIAGWLMYIKLVCGEESKAWMDVASWDAGFWGKFMHEFEKYNAVDVGSEQTETTTA